MKLQTRKRIFYVFLLLFVVIGGGVVLYAEGWRIDFTTLQAEKAGGIYVRSYPENAAITLNGKPVPNQSGFLSPGTFISGLFPKSYTLKLSASGYDAWTETPPVSPSLVTEMKYAVLVPDAATQVATSVDAAAFYEADGNTVIGTAAGTLLWRAGMIGSGTIVSHSSDLKTVIIRTINSRTGAAGYSLYDFTTGSSTNLSPILEADGITPSVTANLFIDPYDDTSLIVQTKAGITGIDTDTYRATAIEAAPAGEAVETAIAVSPSAIAWARAIPPASTTADATGSSQVIVYDKFSGDTIDSSLIVQGPVRQLAWINGGALGILEDDNSLYIYNVAAEQLVKLADDVRQFYPAPDGSAIAALEYNSLEVFVSNPQEYYRFNLPSVGDIGTLLWYKDDAHLFVQYPNHISFLDLADLSLRNFTTVSLTGNGATAQYDAQENSLYLIDQGQKLLRFDFPQ